MPFCIWQACGLSYQPHQMFWNMFLLHDRVHNVGFGLWLEETILRTHLKSTVWLSPGQTSDVEEPEKARKVPLARMLRLRRPLERDKERRFIHQKAEMTLSKGAKISLNMKVIKDIWLCCYIELAGYFDLGFVPFLWRHIKKAPPLACCSGLLLSGGAWLVCSLFTYSSFGKVMK